MENKAVNCQKCGREIPDGEACEFRGQTLCDDCCMDAMSPPKACDPWAVYNATRTRGTSGDSGADGLTETQKKVYEFIRARSKTTRDEIMNEFNISRSELENITATLRHCEMVRGQKEGDKVYIVPY
jgi:hypothetical protein